MADNGTGQTGPRVNIHEPLSPPFYQASPANQGPYALLTAVILIIITGLTLMIKFRTVAATFRRPRRDDIALAAALVFALGYTIALCQAVNRGLGRVASELTTNEAQLLSQSYYVSNILLYLSLASAKASATMLIIAIKPSRRMLVSFYSVLAIVGIWAIAAVLAVALQCKPTRWVMGPSTSDTCIDQYGAQVGIRLVDIATDAALALLPAVMVSSIQMSFHKRLVVAFMFGLRLVQVTPVLTAISLVKLGNFYNATLEDRPFEAVVPSIWTSLAPNVSIITACLPSIKRFLTDWAVGVANAGIAETYELQNSSRSYGNGQPPTVRSYTSPHSRRRSEDRSQAVYDGGATHEYRTRRRGDDHSRVENDAESERGLTDGILQTIDYRVEFEEAQHRRECSEGSKR
ncbi:hypothetical protein LTR82_003432 [Friedmanniomyces endolithicus]|uniref:Rhodopsin domain-containing protein n=1 Tax=Friedmanniomyces endolithicus TaxID=329885 RepID=A0AAN6FXR0_9PEZI|nr:hypothetical protein LTR82_003432 [Friedmanniomyces endolithicus]